MQSIGILGSFLITRVFQLAVRLHIRNLWKPLGGEEAINSLTVTVYRDFPALRMMRLPITNEESRVADLRPSRCQE
jgi:predicted DNA-binding transcriptional regulator YafY